MSTGMLGAVLVANRGEIAVRLLRACKVRGIRAVAVYSEADAGALHVRLADEAYLLGPAPARESYLDIERILHVAREARVDAIHPGYGLLSENADFAARVVAAGFTFIGPEADVIATMGDKVAARAAAKASGVPLLPGSEGVIDDPVEARRIAADIGFPLVVKACFGGGGRGMRVVREMGELEAALEQAGRESGAAFGRAEVYLERYVSHARHVEVQILADRHGTVLHLGDRDCSVQRRHQKLIEEAPAPSLPDDLRAAMLDAAVTLARSVGYRSAGTVEFLVDPAGKRFYFLEMNTRLQVEHGVTELVTGIDLVDWQLRIAAGEPLDFGQDEVRVQGHAIQARIGAEDPWEGFRPDPGAISRLSLPLGPWLRLDFGVESGDVIPGHYDAMFGKVQAFGPDRETTRRHLVNALGDLKVEGVATTAPYLRHVLEEREFIDVAHDTGSVERGWHPDPARCPPASIPQIQEPETAVKPLSERRVTVATSRGPLDIAIFGRGQGNRRGGVGGAGDGSAPRKGEPVAPMDASVVNVAVTVGQQVAAGEVLVTLEAMKMELQVKAPRDGTVEQILVNPGDQARRGTLLVKLSAT
ncbi:MAG: biotin carboxylase N-terminal domain-containing protein [Porticoccaceae bacterium]